MHGIPHQFLNAYQGQVGIILGNGPSVADYDLTDPFFTENVTIGSNAIGHSFAPDYYLVCDPKAWRVYRGYIVEAKRQKPEMVIVTGSMIKKDRGDIVLQYKMGNVVGPPGPTIYHGRTSGILMLHLAYHLGFRYIFLLGIDGYSVSGPTSHFYRDGRVRVSSDKVVGKSLGLARHKLESEGRYLYNLSGRSVFNQVPRWHERGEA